MKDLPISCAECKNPDTDGHVYFHIKTNTKIFLCEICAKTHKLNGYEREALND